MGLAEDVLAIEWYHTLELAPGVITPGWFDLRPVVHDVGLPRSLEGKRCLDVGTFDGFWAFEMERRGAAEVVAVDVLDPAKWDWPAGSDDAAREEIGRRKGSGRGFAIARDALGSSVVRHETSVYDVSPADLGMFDFVYAGSLLLHLRDPIGALRAMRSVCSGSAVLVDAVDLALSILPGDRPLASLDGRGRPWWWKPNVAALVRMAEAAGFEVVGAPRRLFLPPGAGQPKHKVSWRSLRHRTLVDDVARARRGDPHCAITVRPQAAHATRPRESA